MREVTLDKYNIVCVQMFKVLMANIHWLWLTLRSMSMFLSLKKLFEDKQIYHTHRNVHSSYSLTWFSLSLLFWDTVSIYNLNHYLSSPNMNRQGLFKLDSLDLKDPRSRLRSHCDNRVVSQLAMNFLSVQSHHHKMSCKQEKEILLLFNEQNLARPGPKRK